jgi:hypothetical protein
MKQITDTDRINLIEHILLHMGGVVQFRDEDSGPMNNIPEGKSIQTFTVPSQHQSSSNVREALDTILEFATGRRDWKKENWGDIDPKSDLGKGLLEMGKMMNRQACGSGEE